ncbi:MAG: hypothetical protein Q9159_001230 [Coniocarpon cinnabarinum]
MTSFYYNPSHHSAMPTMPSVSAHTHNGSRSRRGARFGSSNSHHQQQQHPHPHPHQQHHHTKSFKPSRATREAAELAQLAAVRKDFEAARSFDLDDDEIFCPWHLLTEDDVSSFESGFEVTFAHDVDESCLQLHSIHSSSSDRSSSSDGSPDQSPLQPQIQPAQHFNLSAQAQPHLPAMQHGNASHLKIHQPMAQRQRNAIPIVDPNSRHTSPPNSISPNRQAQKHYGQRRW